MIGADVDLQVAEFVVDEGSRSLQLNGRLSRRIDLVRLERPLSFEVLARGGQRSRTSVDGPRFHAPLARLSMTGGGHHNQNETKGQPARRALSGGKSPTRRASP